MRRLVRNRVETLQSVGAHGRCTEIGFLEFHYVVPFSIGGEATIENFQLRRRAHNQYEAYLFFGELFIHANRVRVLRRLGPDRVPLSARPVVVFLPTFTIAPASVCWNTWGAELRQAPSRFEITSALGAALACVARWRNTRRGPAEVRRAPRQPQPLALVRPVYAGGALFWFRAWHFCYLVQVRGAPVRITLAADLDDELRAWLRNHMTSLACKARASAASVTRRADGHDRAARSSR